VLAGYLDVTSLPLPPSMSYDFLEHSFVMFV
jgi:hypothetical protein